MKNWTALFLGIILLACSARAQDAKPDAPVHDYSWKRTKPDGWHASFELMDLPLKSDPATNSFSAETDNFQLQMARASDPHTAGEIPADWATKFLDKLAGDEHYTDVIGTATPFKIGAHAASLVNTGITEKLQKKAYYCGRIWLEDKDDAVYEIKFGATGVGLSQLSHLLSSLRVDDQDQAEPTHEFRNLDYPGHFVLARAQTEMDLPVPPLAVLDGSTPGLAANTPAPVQSAVFLSDVAHASVTIAFYQFDRAVNERLIIRKAINEIQSRKDVAQFKLTTDVHTVLADAPKLPDGAVPALDATVDYMAGDFIKMDRTTEIRVAKKGNRLWVIEATSGDIVGRKEDMDRAINSFSPLPGENAPVTQPATPAIIAPDGAPPVLNKP